MRSPLPSTIVIECPHCRTRYQVSMDTIGPHGRQVQCAHCARAWQAVAAAGGSQPPAGEELADRLFDEAEERELDAAFAAAELPAAAATEPEQPPVSPGESARPEPREDPEQAAPPAAEASADPAAGAEDTGDGRKRSKAFTRRQDALSRRLPLAQLRRMVRLVALTVLAFLLLGLVIFRTEIVRVLPDLAGTYGALGLGVNIVGLEFSDFNTLLTQHNGSPTLRVDARIDNVAGRNVAVPPVVVSLLDASGVSLYEWSVQPEAGDLEPGEAVDFSTQLSAPPADAAEVRLSFASGRSQPHASIAAIETGTP
jgi:predicted Zn finger-like uncharacterized protein